MDADEKRKVFEELLEEYQNFIESEFSYEDGEREAERKAWLNKYDGIKEPLIKDEKVRKAVRAWTEVNNLNNVAFEDYDDENVYFIDRDYEPQIWFSKKSILGSPLDDGKIYTIAELCGEEEE